MRSLPLLLCLFAALAFCRPAAQDFSALSKQAAAAREANRETEALEFYTRALGLEPDWEDGLWYSGLLKYKHDHYAPAVDLLRHLVAVAPGRADGWILLGLSEYQIRQYDRASVHVQRGLSIGLGSDKNMAQAGWYFTSILLTRSGHFDEGLGLLFDGQRTGSPNEAFVVPAGLAALRLALAPPEVPPSRQHFIESVGRAVVTMYGDRNLGSASAQLKDLAERYPDESGIHFLYGACLLSSGADADGIAQLQRELEITPDHLAAAVALVDEYLRQQQAGLALPVAESAVRFHDEESAAHLALGEVLAASGKLDDGIKELEKAESQAPDVARVHFSLSRAYLAAKRTADATREQAEFQKLNEEAGK